MPERLEWSLRGANAPDFVLLAQPTEGGNLTQTRQVSSTASKPIRGIILYQPLLALRYADGMDSR